MEITATEKLTTKPRPVAIQPVMPSQEVRSTHSCTCPRCGTEIRIRVGDEAHLFGACRHVHGIVERDNTIAVEFEAEQ